MRAWELGGRGWEIPEANPAQVVGAHGGGADLWLMRPGEVEKESEQNQSETQENWEERSVALPWKRKLCDMIARAKCSSCC